jgi:hypothetical protein
MPKREDRLPSSVGSQSREDGANRSRDGHLGKEGSHGSEEKSGGNGVQVGTSGGSYGGDRGEIFGNNEAAQGPTSSCSATQRAKETDPRRLWIPEEVGCGLQKGVPSCSSGTAQGNKGFRDKTIWHREPRRNGRPG